MQICVVVVVVVCSLVLQPCNADDGKSPPVRVVAEYDPPSSFTGEPPSYRAASSLTLSCEVEGVENPYYEWSSTCSGSCFVRGRDATVSTPYLHSYDTGVHTCTVYDALGCAGNGSITVNVVGAGVVVQPGDKVLPNNSVIIALSNNLIPHFHCLSGSLRTNTGKLIGPLGTDITFKNSDPFTVRRGRGTDLGTLLVFSSSNAMETDDNGIYTYHTPDENGDTVDFHFGIYDSTHSIPPQCHSIEYTFMDNIHTLSCVSYNSPPTNVIWERDGERIYFNNTSYHSSQMLMNRITSAYNNTLTINATIEDVIGVYTCTVSNDLGSSYENTTVKALEVSGHGTPIPVGLASNITCSTHLEVVRMEWVVVAVGNAVEEREDGGQSLVLPLKPTSTGQDGAEFTCKITTIGGKIFSETITVEVKELIHEVEVSGPSYPLSAGGKYSLTCTVTSDLPVSVQWLDPSDHEVDGSDVSLKMGETVIEGNTTTLILHFDPIRTSHGGTYTCKSTISELSSEKTVLRNVTVQMTSDSVNVTRSPSIETLYTADPLNLTCVTKVHQAVDVPVVVTHQWTGPGGVVSSNSSSGVNVSGVTGSGNTYTSMVMFNSLLSSQVGTYTCSSTVSPVGSPVFIVSGAVQTSSISFSAVIRVIIQIYYALPDDDYPHYSPPNYRPTSSVTMKCVASGTTGSVNYRWNSTCSDCFVVTRSHYANWNPWYYSIYQSFLTFRDAGEHTCYVRDDGGNTGSNTTTMNIVGAGTYINYYYRIENDNYGLRTQKLATTMNNAVAVPTERDYYRSRVSLEIRCCSNTSLPTGNITVPSGYNEGSFNSDGCYRFYFIRYVYIPGYSNLSSYGYSGVFTCNIRDTEGNEFNSNIGVYDPGYHGRPSISGMSCNSSSSTSITLVCSTRDAPPSSIKWYRDDTLVDINGNSTDMNVRLTNRTSSNFEITLQISNSLDDIVGNYRCEVGNRQGNDAQSYSVYRTTGVPECSQSEFVVGETVNCSCSSNKESSSNKWYRGNSSIPLNTDISEDGAQLTIPVTTDIEGEMYTCSVLISCWEWKDTITVSVTVPDDWATVEITNSTNQNALHNTNYVLTCTVRGIPGMNLVPSLEWVGPDGVVVVSEGNRTVGQVETQGTTSTLTLSFNPVLSSDGGRYTCRAAISVPWMATQPQTISSSVTMAVTTQALFQLRLRPSALCANLDVDKALDLESSIKRNVEAAVRERCDCDFSSTAIYSGKFSCDQDTHVTYRAIVNGTTDLLTADQLMEHIQDWRETRGTLLHDIIYLNLASASECTVRINSFEDDKCGA